MFGHSSTFIYAGQMKPLLERSPARLLKWVLSADPYFFFPYGHYGLGGNFGRKKVDAGPIIRHSVWGNFCAMYALYISRYAPGMKRRRWDPELFKRIFEGQLLLEFNPTLRRSEILIKGTGYPFFKWLKSMAKPSDEEVYGYFDTQPAAPYITPSGEPITPPKWNYKWFDPALLPKRQILWANTYYPNQWSRIGPSIIYYAWPGRKLINRYSIGLHPNGYFIKNYARYRYNPAGGWSALYRSPYESGDEAIQRAWDGIPYVSLEEREVQQPLSSWVARQRGLQPGATETITKTVMVDTRDNSIIDYQTVHKPKKYRDELNARLKDAPKKKSFIEWKRDSFAPPRSRAGGIALVIDTAQYPETPPETYFSINYANGLFEHLPQRISNAKVGDDIYFNLGPSFRKK